ncbi:hypothetical protein [Xenorhabdus sp. KJ12.1]|uniref:hypothetical protein n=1 Tax=Xenorhabdus sp. KJ12.1 TaxID=1851571 RepID=UPI0012900408|nr:hypothetical protein [Xenorhabdus sp. KJ12.1]
MRKSNNNQFLFDSFYGNAIAGVSSRQIDSRGRELSAIEIANISYEIAKEAVRIRNSKPIE